MGFDAFLKIDGIPGESQDAKHPDWIEVLSFSHGLSQPTSATASSSGGGGVARCHHLDFSIVKELDNSSPILALKCSAGTHINEVILALCRAGGAKEEYMRYTMSRVIISSVTSRAASGEDGVPTEEITFNYGKIEWDYKKQKRSGGLGGGSTVGNWNLQTNAPD